MDRREMKKHILFQALRRYDQFHSPEQIAFQVRLILDRDEVTESMQRRFVLVLREMVENAESKLE